MGMNKNLAAVLRSSLYTAIFFILWCLLRMASLWHHSMPISQLFDHTTPIGLFYVFGLIELAILTYTVLCNWADSLTGGQH